MSYKTYEKYKSSNVEWMGGIPTHWQTNRFKIVFSYSKGKNPQTFFDESGEGLAPYLSMEYLRNDITPTYVPIKECPLKASSGDILLLWDGSNAGEFVVSKEGLVSSTMAKLKPNIIINNKFSKYICKAIEPLLRELTIGMGVPHVSSLELNNILLPNMSLEEQKQIANYLDKKTAKIDSTITKNEELIQLLEEKRVALINQVVTKGLNPDVAMKDSGVEWIGEIPEHWDITKVKHELDFLDHKRIPLSAEVRSDMDRIYDYYGASGVIDKVDSYLFNGKYILVGEDGANLLSRSTPLAFIAEGKFWVNNHAHILNPKDENNIDYFVSLLEAVDYTPFIEGSAQPKLTADNLKNIILIKPPLVEQNEIAKFLNLKLNHNNHTLSKIQENINLLEEYKTSLIHHVVTGR